MQVSVYNFEGASSDGVEGHEPHMLETRRAYATYEAMRDEMLQSALQPRKKLRDYPPERMKRLLRSIWNFVKRIRAKLKRV